MTKPFRPELPPVEGYVEVEFEGEHRYKNVRTGNIEDPLDFRKEPDLTMINAKINANDERQEFIEDVVAEMAGEVYS